MTQLTFDLAASIDAKVAGMSIAESNRATLLVTARSAARLIARQKGVVTIDDVVEAMQERGYAMMGNASGSVFKGSEWLFVNFTPSRRVSNHGRMVRTWRLK